MFIIIIIVTFRGQEGCNIKVFSMPGQPNIHYYIASHFFFVCLCQVKNILFSVFSIYLCHEQPQHHPLWPWGQWEMMFVGSQWPDHEDRWCCMERWHSHSSRNSRLVHWSRTCTGLWTDTKSLAMFYWCNHIATSVINIPHHSSRCQKLGSHPRYTNKI